MGSMGHLNEFPLNGAEAEVETELEQYRHGKGKRQAALQPPQCTTECMINHIPFDRYLTLLQYLYNDGFKKIKNTVKRYST
jgi:hypothetical protein